MSIIEFLQVDTVALRANLFLVLDHDSIWELVRSVLDVGKGLLSTLPIVKVNLEFARVSALLSVDLILEVVKELLKSVNGVSSGHIWDIDRCFKDWWRLALSLHLFDATRDHWGNLRAHDLGNLATVFPEYICDALLAKLTVNTHVKFEVFMDHHRQEVSLAALQVSVMFRASIEHNIS